MYGIGGAAASAEKEVEQRWDVLAALGGGAVPLLLLLGAGGGVIALCSDCRVL